MKKIIFDTSVYGELIKDKETFLKVSKFIPDELVIYGIKIIRNELKNTPRYIKEGNRSRRMLLLEVYDIFVRKEKHDLKYNKLIETLSEDYFKEYKKQGGSLAKHNIKNDFLIIATATIYNLDVVVSKDEHSMLSEKSIKSYDIVNNKYGLSNPNFERYKDFKRKIMRFYQHDKL